ncbi:response regulator [Arthrobacter parietis]|uniref:Response regulator n=1 Tax=Arthrobacter parietis TaxID=271434 RepID=A0ABN3APS0_9MICC
MEEIRVLVVDDQPLMGRALKMFVNAADGMTTVGEASDGHIAVQQCVSLKPDVVLMDMQMPIMNGVEATRKIVQTSPGVRVIAVTTFSSERYLVPALRAGASGYLVKDAEPEEIIDAIRAVHDGGCVLSRNVTEALISSIRDAPELPQELTPVAPASVEALTPRETKIVQLLGQGMSNAETARELHLAEATVKTHLGRIMAKWKVRDRVQVVIFAAKNGVIHLSSSAPSQPSIHPMSENLR